MNLTVAFQNEIKPVWHSSEVASVKELLVSAQPNKYLVLCEQKL